MGFKATEAVEALEYDFEPHVKGDAAKGTIPEPTSQQIEQYRSTIVAAMREAGFESADLKADLAKMDDIMEASAAIEEATVVATADLTGIAPNLLRDLPYRVKAAFVGWIMGQFFSPEA